MEDRVFMGMGEKDVRGYTLLLVTPGQTWWGNDFSDKVRVGSTFPIVYYLGVGW